MFRGMRRKDREIKKKNKGVDNNGNVYYNICKTFVKSI